MDNKLLVIFKDKKVGETIFQSTDHAALMRMLETSEPKSYLEKDAVFSFTDEDNQIRSYKIDNVSLFVYGINLQLNTGELYNTQITVDVSKI